jgi:hypothetical protein
MNYSDQIKNIESIKITKDLEETIQICTNNFWMSHRGSKQTRDDVNNLSCAISDRNELTLTDVETLCWLLDRYGFKDELRMILYGRDNKIKTEYEDD